MKKTDVLGNTVDEVVIAGDTLAEQKTQADATGGIVTFSQPLSNIEIYNTDATNDGVFTVNGINITVPATKAFKSKIGGTPAVTVSITGSTTYILSRYV